MRYRFLLLLCIFTGTIQGQAQAKNPLVLLSIDGFAQDYIEQYQPVNLKRLIQDGCSAEAMLPVYPSKTFPNHLSLVTGVYPAKHGIIHNKFYRADLDDSYYLGAGKHNADWLTALPIWTVAEQQGVTTAIYYWPESEAMVAGERPSYFLTYDHSTPNAARFKQIISWLAQPETTRPQFIAAYFSVIDSAGHDFGPDSLAVAQAVAGFDQLLGDFIGKLKREFDQQVDVIIVSDHGMVQSNANSAIFWQDLLVRGDDVRIINGGTQLLVYANAQEKLLQIQSVLGKTTEKYTVYLKPDYPAHWHWDIPAVGIPDLIVEAKSPYVFVDEHTALKAGSHGYDALANPALSAIFVAAGPSFEKARVMPKFENIQLFPLLTTLLGIKPPPNIDGTIAVLSPCLRPANVRQLTVQKSND